MSQDRDPKTRMNAAFESIVLGAFPPDAYENDDRAKVGVVLKKEFENNRQALFDAYLKAPEDTRNFIRSLSDLTDKAVVTAIELAERSTGIVLKDHASVLAVGGCGRGEMAPFSDVDLLFLLPSKSPVDLTKTVEAVLYLLWDMKMKVGHATRTVKEAVELSRSDITIRTSILENRLIYGAPSRARKLNTILRETLFPKTQSEFVEEKLAERDARHLRQGGARYLLEPNVKEGKGGLRDLQTLFWITKYVSRSDSTADMVRAGYFTQDEVDAFNRAEEFLWTVRCHLHLSTGRAVEKLTFDQQVDVAEQLGYKSDKALRGVEYFMQDFFRNATTVGDLTRILLTALEAIHVKPQPSFKQRLTNFFSTSDPVTAPSGYMIKHGRLNILDPDTFLNDPLNMLRIYQEALTSDVLIHPDAMRVISANLDLITNDMRNDPKAQNLFLSLLLDHGNPERALRRMNELGVLGRFIPEFERIVALMQFNFYHHYTVDEHTIQCISHLARIENKKTADKFPIASQILQKGLNRRVLYVALLLHDIGKGLPQDHEVIGAEMAAKIAPRLSLDEDETDLVVWLVRNHLIMSDAAQKRDLSDPKTITDFAEQVQSVRRLNLLTVLTVCDILGVGPGTLTAWKAELLRSLYRATLKTFRDGTQGDALEETIMTKQAALSQVLSDWDAASLTAELDRHYPQFWIGLDTGSQAVISGLLRKISPEGIEIAIDEDQTGEATRICFALQDHPGIFARLAGAVALAGMNVIDARTHITKDGYAIAAFWVQDSQFKALKEGNAIDRLTRMIHRTLSGEVSARDAIEEKDKIAKRERKIRVPTEITFDNEGSNSHTIIEVDTRDRPGLLYDLTSTLAESNIRISNATIATYGAQAVDTFYIKDIFGLKIHSSHKQAAIADKLKSAIESGANRALKA
ncbi:MAG: [protein-PII] uridylyltransferase [Pseudomonadota bacterium]